MNFCEKLNKFECFLKILSDKNPKKCNFWVLKTAEKLPEPSNSAPTQTATKEEAAILAEAAWKTEIRARERNQEDDFGKEMIGSALNKIIYQIRPFTKEGKKEVSVNLILPVWEKMLKIEWLTLFWLARAASSGLSAEFFS